MNGRDFFDGVAAHDELNWLGAKTNDDGVDCVYVAHKRLGSKTEIPIAEVIASAAQDLIDVLLGRRDAKVMRHVTRIVGYYSELQNWNGSKLAELADRHKGEYGLPEQPAAPARPSDPVPVVERELVVA